MQPDPFRRKSAAPVFLLVHNARGEIGSVQAGKGYVDSGDDTVWLENIVSWPKEREKRYAGAGVEAFAAQLLAEDRGILEGQL